ncbi:hypothetical protein Clacol_007588 [Clathrus columnatus]|uniref:Sas10 C-terminal domain-containing protein n=1 Tax=Clathrus columnatus TaxID=1419009 RepID=A0AAV5AFB5_9AGAM|nr:hypothetical protein Clacol_007588 [Clathrus columnatus]
MPRRPRKQPGLTRQKGSKISSEPSGRNDGKVKKWNRRVDIELDEEDQFHQTRDRILLEGNTHDEEELWEDGEEEVFGLGLDTNSEGDSVTDEDEGEEIHRETNLSAAKKTKKGKISKRAPSSSSSSGSESEEETWGRKKSAYYASNADALNQKQGDEDEEEINEMEEQEARKIQTRMKNLLFEEDYGLADVHDRPIGFSEETDMMSALPPIAPTEPIDNVTALRRLEKTSPETLALSREWCYVVRDLQEVEERIQNGNTLSSESDTVTDGLKHLHHQTLLSYVTVLAFYIHLRASEGIVNHPANIPNTRIKAVLERLLTLKQALSTMEELDFDVSNYEDESDISDTSASSDSEVDPLISSKINRRKLVDMDELYALLKEADEMKPSKTSRTKHSSSAHDGIEKPKLSAKKPKKNESQEDVIFDLVEPSFKASRSFERSVIKDDTSDVYGEVTGLSTADAADKKSRRHTLRFHTHKIESSSRKREQSREKLGGDDDIPYPERKKEKEARIQKEVLKTRGTGGDDLELNDIDEGSPPSEVGPAKRKRAESSDSEGDEGYYELVKRAKKSSKEQKKREYDQARLAERVYDDEGGEGPRSLTRAILKNRGLTPRRSKSVRNPRVKKRERYEKAKKKVKSQKAVYKGGLGGRPYGGEESGISKIVKSVKLG